MQKMDGSIFYPKEGMKVCGKYGKYLVKNHIGRGGNGLVYAADVIQKGELLSIRDGYVIKFLIFNSKDTNEIQKRKSRFKKEIEQVLSLQNDIKGIVPIFDSSIFCEEQSDLLWYLMPKGEVYNYKKETIERKLEHMLCLGKCLKQLHNLGCAHRDIKPKNLLILDGQIYLGDFGLIWNIRDIDEKITEVNDCLGPQAIRPPELQSISDVNGIDYRKSDVYLFGKTIWMVLNNNNRGFSAEYSRVNNEVYLFRDKLQLETAEPLHRLMEGSTKDRYWERIDIIDCIEYIEKQLLIIRGNIPQETLLSWKYIEQVRRGKLTLPADELIYKDPQSILKILKSMINVVCLSFTENEKQYGTYPLKKAKHIQNNLYEIEIINPYLFRKKITIELALKDICLKEDEYYVIHSTNYSFDSKPIPIFRHVKQALESGNNRVRLNSPYLIRMTIGE